MQTNFDHDFQKFLQEAPAAPDSLRRSLRKKPDMRPAGAALLLVLLLGAGVWFYGWNGLHKDTPMAEAPVAQPAAVMQDANAPAVPQPQNTVAENAKTPTTASHKQPKTAYASSSSSSGLKSVASPPQPAPQGGLQLVAIVPATIHPMPICVLEQEKPALAPAEAQVPDLLIAEATPMPEPQRQERADDKPKRYYYSIELRHFVIEGSIKSIF